MSKRRKSTHYHTLPQGRQRARQQELDAGAAALEAKEAALDGREAGLQQLEAVLKQREARVCLSSDCFLLV